MNKEESKVGIYNGKSFLKVFPKTTFDFKWHQSSPLGSAFNSFGAKRALLKAPKTHVNRQEIVYLEKINEIVDGLKMPNVIVGIGSHASTHQCAFYIYAFKS